VSGRWDWINTLQKKIRFVHSKMRFTSNTPKSGSIQRECSWSFSSFFKQIHVDTVHAVVVVYMWGMPYRYRAGGRYCMYVGQAQLKKLEKLHQCLFWIPRYRPHTAGEFTLWERFWFVSSPIKYDLSQSEKFHIILNGQIFQSLTPTSLPPGDVWNLLCFDGGMRYFLV